MKKETKRYYLVEYCGSINRKLKDIYKYERMLKSINLSNKRRSSKYICGNVTFYVNNDESVTANVHVYNRLIGPVTISEIDNYTTSMSYEELVSKFESDLCTKENYTPDINVCYFETKNKDEDCSNKKDIGIKYIPVIYKRDKQFLDINSIRNYLKFQADTHNYDFFKGLCNELCFYLFIGDEIEELYKVIDKVKSHRLDISELYRCSLKLFSKFIKEYDRNGKYVYDKDGKVQISKRRLRDFGMYIRYYNIERNSPIKYNGKEKCVNQYKKLR